MEAEVMNGKNREHNVSVDVGDDRANGLSESSSDREATTHAVDSASGTKPCVGMEIDSEEAARTFYDSYARSVGFSTHVGQFTRTKPDGPITSWNFACSREVFRRENVESCNALLKIKRKGTDNRVVSKFVEEHNHSIVPPNKVHCSQPRRHFTSSVRDVSEPPDATNDVYISLDGNGVSFETNAEERCASSVEHNQPSQHVGCVHVITPGIQRRTLGRDAKGILNYFRKMQSENPGFYYAIQLDDYNCMTNVFWADARSRLAYNHFGDAVIFDTMYRPKHYQVPFAPFTGVNNHGRMILFGCALLLNESELSFTWLFETWLCAMNDKPPISITTDQDKAIKAAVAKVFPGTRHCICKWHILREGQERLAHICLAHPSFYGDFYGCINFSETREDFEKSWGSLLDQYDIQNNEWLQAVYDARKQWAPVYFRDTFFGAISSNHGLCSFFDGYVNQRTTVLLFFKQYEKALKHSIEKEMKADYDTMFSTPVLKTPSPMEQQAANLYTKKIFAKFQEELVETFAYIANKIEGDEVVGKYRVAKYDDNDKEFMVSLNLSVMSARCSCQMFEYCGILCRHILTVFTVTNVLTLPSPYILKRWTRKAKSSLASVVPNTELSSLENLTMRFNNLCREALKFAEEGAFTGETYNTAVKALEEGIEKITSVKKKAASVTFSYSTVCGNSQDNTSPNTPASAEMIPSLWSSQETLFPNIDLNNGGVPVADLNQPGITPVSIDCSGGPVTSDNMVIRTCFKSMTWTIESNTLTPAGKVAAINLKLQDYGPNSSEEKKVQFRLTKASLEPMMKSMAYTSQHLSTPANRVAVINLKLQDSKVSSGETEVKFQVSRETLSSMLRSMACIREQL